MITKGYKTNGGQKILISQGNEFDVDCDLVISVIDNLDSDQSQNAFRRKYGNEMFDYINRSIQLPSSSLFYTPGFNFRANFVYFINKTNITKRSDLDEAIKQIHSFVQSNFLENVSIIVEDINKLTLGVK